MNYRHAYHAGNFADVLKHVILARVITYMTLKPQPFRVIDTHAGAGRYDLNGVEAGKTGEWRDGIARLVSETRPPEITALLQPYLDAVASVNLGGELSFYPGSPLIARHVMRVCDQLVANELHGEDFELLKDDLRRASSTTVLNLDAWQAVKSLLPPKERRGVVLIDPPFEKTDEFVRLAEAMDAALKRFATGVFLIWYPLKNTEAASCFVDHVSAAAGGKVLDVRLRICKAEAGLGLTGSGVLVVNPPYTLKPELELLLPYLTAVLQEGTGAGFELDLGSA